VSLRVRVPKLARGGKESTDRHLEVERREARRHAQQRVLDELPKPAPTVAAGESLDDFADLEVTLRESAERAVRHAEERTELLRTIRELRAQAPDTVLDVGRQAARSLAAIVRRRLWP
jgi:hypothetical protein